VITCTRRLTFEAGHRVVGHENKCANPHGHSYKVFLEAEAGRLDSVGRVIDFSVLKAKVGGWIDKRWDHAMILFEKDDLLMTLLREDCKVFALPLNPTAENLASLLGSEYGQVALEGTGVRLKSVTVWETENCFATWQV
jgi:6-pyruvoyltetrahydropterin/6-carboxytetrahydropterin synthase